MRPDRPLGTDGPLLESVDALFVDLDGVLYVGDQPVPHAAEVLTDARRAGSVVLYVTNNASRTPADVASDLRRLGADATAADVLTSAVVAAERLAETCAAGSPVLVVGGDGLRTAVADVGLTVVASADDAPVAVVQGWGPEVGWAELAEAALAIRAGVTWVVTNRDTTLPSPRGPLPGSGALVAALVTATGRQPSVVVGKPQPDLFEVARRRTGARMPLVVGDRLGTDIAGARAAGLRSLLVLTGVTTPAELLAAPPDERPDHLGADLRALQRPSPEVSISGSEARCGQVRVTADGRVAGDRPVPDAMDGLRAACALAWSGALGPQRYADVLDALDLT